MIRKFLSVALAVLMVVTTTTALFGQGGVVDPTKQWMVADNVSPISLGDVGGCGVALTTGVYAANPANSGAQAAPSTVRGQAQNNVLMVTTSAAASALTLTCDIIPAAYRTTPNKGIQLTGLTVYYGTQTSALTSVTSPNTLSSIQLPATPGAAASGVVTSPLVAPTVTFSPVLASAQLTTVTLGQCFRQDVIFSAPITINNISQRIMFEEIFNQTVASATVYTICGVDVYYNNIVF